jgi:hypothetical protein
LAVLLDLTAYPSWQNGVERIDIEDTDEQGRPRTTTWSVKALGLKSSHSVRYEYPAPNRFEYHLVHSDVMTRYDFGCEVNANGDGTTEVTLTQELGIKWAMPQAILDKNSRKGITTMLKALKTKAEAADPGRLADGTAA